MTLVPLLPQTVRGGRGRGDETCYQAATRSTATASMPVSVPTPHVAAKMAEILVHTTDITNNGCLMV